MNQTEAVTTIFDVMIAYQGVVGAILGSFGTIIVAHFLRYQGKLKCYLTDFNYYLSQYETTESGDIISKHSGPDLIPDRFIYNFDLTLYNPSDIVKGYSEMKALFVCEDGTEFIYPMSYQIEKFGGPMRTLETFNFPVKEIITFAIDTKMHISIIDNETYPTKDIVKIYLRYRNSNGNLKKKKLWKLDRENFVNAHRDIR